MGRAGRPKKRAIGGVLDVCETCGKMYVLATGCLRCAVKECLICKRPTKLKNWNEGQGKCKQCVGVGRPPSPERVKRPRGRPVGSGRPSRPPDKIFDALIPADRRCPECLAVVLNVEEWHVGLRPAVCKTCYRDHGQEIILRRFNDS